MPEIRIRAATVADLAAALDDREALAKSLGKALPDAWPEKGAMFRYAAEQLKLHPEEAEWRVYFLS